MLHRSYAPAIEKAITSIANGDGFLEATNAEALGFKSKPHAFELVVNEILRGNGYFVTDTKGSGDGGCDGKNLETSLAIQTKTYSKPMTKGAVLSVIEDINKKRNRKVSGLTGAISVIIVSTSGYAKGLNQKTCPARLIGPEELRELARQYSSERQMGVELYPHNQDASLRALGHLRNGKSVIYTAATGTGKTAVGKSIIDAVCNATDKILILVSSTGPQMEAFAGALNYYPNITIQHYSTLRGRSDKGDDLSGYKLIIADEAHSLYANQTKPAWDDLLAANPGAHVLGVTATPERMSGENAIALFDAHVDGVSWEDAQAQGITTKMKYSIVMTEAMETEFVAELAAAGEGPHSDDKVVVKARRNIEQIMSQSIYHNGAAKALLSRANDRAIVFGSTVEEARKHAVNFAAAAHKLSTAGGRVTVLEYNSGMPKAEQQLVIDKFQSAKGRYLLAVVDMLTEGAHLKYSNGARMTGIAMFRNTQSKRILWQTIGRNSQVEGVDGVAHFYDFVDNTETFNTDFGDKLRNAYSLEILKHKALGNVERVKMLYEQRLGYVDTKVFELAQLMRELRERQKTLGSWHYRHWTNLSGYYNEHGQWPKAGARPGPNGEKIYDTAEGQAYYLNYSYHQGELPGEIAKQMKAAGFPFKPLAGKLSDTERFYKYEQDAAQYETFTGWKESSGSVGIMWAHHSGLLWYMTRHMANPSAIPNDTARREKAEALINECAPGLICPWKAPGFIEPEVKINVADVIATAGKYKVISEWRKDNVDDAYHAIAYGYAWYATRHMDKPARVPASESRQKSGERALRPLGVTEFPWDAWYPEGLKQKTPCS